jgi:hypothetical protein
MSFDKTIMDSWGTVPVTVSKAAEAVTITTLFHKHDACTFVKSGKPTCCDGEKGQLCTQAMHNVGIVLLVIILFGIFGDICLLLNNGLITREVANHVVCGGDNRWYWILGVGWSMVVNVLLVAICLQFDFMAGGFAYAAAFIFKCIRSGDGEQLKVTFRDGHSWGGKIAMSITTIHQKLLVWSIIQVYSRERMNHYQRTYTEYINKHEGFSI